MNALLSALKWIGLALLCWLNPTAAYCVLDTLDDDDDE